MIYYPDVVARPDGTLVRVWTDDLGGAFVEGVRRPIGGVAMGTSAAASATQVLVVAKDHDADITLTTNLLAIFDDGSPAPFSGRVFELGPHAVWLPRSGFIVAWQDTKFTWRWRRSVDGLEFLGAVANPQGSSQGMIDFAATESVAPDGTLTTTVVPRWTDVERSRVVRGKEIFFPTKAGAWWIGGATIGLDGGVIAVNEMTGEARNVCTLPTQVPIKAAVGAPGQIDVAVAFAVTADAQQELFYPQSRWMPFDDMPPMVIPDNVRPGEIVDGGGAHLVWGVDIEGSYWAYDLWIIGKPARFLFHDLRSALEAQFIRRVAGVDVPVVHQGEPVSTTWLAQKTGATIIAYHDDNVDTTDPVKLDALLARLKDLETWQKRGYGIVIGHQGYPRLIGATCLGEGDAIWCIEMSQLIYEAHGFQVFVMLAVWQGNRVGADAHLAYPAGVLARLWILAARLRQRYGGLRALVGFGDGRNDVSTWCTTYRAKLGAATPVSSDPYPRTVIAAAPVPVDCQLSGWDDLDTWMPINPTTDQRTRHRLMVVAPANGGAPCGLFEIVETRPRQKDSGKGLTKKQKEAIAGAAVGGGILAWFLAWRARRKAK